MRYGEAMVPTFIDRSAPIFARARYGSAHSHAANAFAVRRKGRDEGSPATIANGRHDPDQERSATAYGKNRTARIAFASSELAVFADRCPIDQLKHVIVRAGDGEGRHSGGAEGPGIIMHDQSEGQTKGSPL